MPGQAGHGRRTSLAGLASIPGYLSLVSASLQGVSLLPAWHIPSPFAVPSLITGQSPEGKVHRRELILE